MADRLRHEQTARRRRIKLEIGGIGRGHAEIEGCIWLADKSQPRQAVIASIQSSPAYGPAIKRIATRSGAALDWKHIFVERPDLRNQIGRASSRARECMSVQHPMVDEYLT